MSNDKTEKVKRYLEWIAPEGGVEAMAGEPEVLEGLADVPWATAVDAQIAADAVRRLGRGEDVTPEQADSIEAIVLPKERPVVDVVDGSYAAPPPPFQHLAASAARATIEAAIASVGRIEIPDHAWRPYAGTGFVVGEGLLMTNRHVAELFAMGIGREELSFIAGQTAAIDFLRERDRPPGRQFAITRVLMIHPYWDMALVLAEGLEQLTPLTLTVAPPGDLREREVAVVGYPALDDRNNVELQNQIFGGRFNIKRLQPGKLRERVDIVSFRHPVSAVTHDSSTLGGNSGSAVIDVETGKVVGLHFAGRYLEANFAVPTHDLALDPRVVEAGVVFDDEAPAAGGPLPSDSYWRDADPANPVNAVALGSDRPEQPGATLAVSTQSEGEGLSWSVPLEISLQIRPAAAAPAAADAGPAIEALVEPFRDEDFSNRKGYDEGFLGIPVPLPSLLDEGIASRLDDGSHVVPYEHFSVVVDKNRRLAVFTASNVDADPARKEPEPGRDYTRRGLSGLDEDDKEKWFTDPRIPAIHQLPNRFFDRDRTSFDKGHIVRREDVAWGDTFDQVRRANGDTYHVTNCSPQIASFNRSALRGVWGQLEDLILDQAETERYSLFAGPVMRDDDRVFRGVDDDGTIQVRIPRRFWKVVVARSGDELQAFAFILDQDLSGVDFESVAVDPLEFAVDELWRSRMISLADLQELVPAIAFPQVLKDSDQIDAGGGEAVRAASGVETF
jgi:endonuclease G, mitochondrial